MLFLTFCGTIYIMHVCVLSWFSHIWLCDPTVLCDPRGPQAPLSMQFFRQEYWSGLPCPPPGDLPDPGIKPASLMYPALTCEFFTTNTTWDTLIYINKIFIKCWFIMSDTNASQKTEGNFFSFIFISWSLITLQYCSGFCHTLTWISHGFTCIPHPDPPSHLRLYPLPLGLPSAPCPSACPMHPT